MGEIRGLKEYLDQKYANSVFDDAIQSGVPYTLHLHGHKSVSAIIKEDLIFDIRADLAGTEEIVQKIQIKYLHSSDLNDAIKPLIKEDKKVKQLALEPISRPHERYFVKNKNLFPLMKEREVLFFTLLEGDLIRGVISDFSRYDITIHLKGGIPLTILRHSIYDVKNKKGRCFLKSFQEERKDWEKSELYMAQTV